MANNVLTISMITKESLMVLENSLKFAGSVNRQYDSQFSVTGAKIGATVNVRRPARFIGTSGPNLAVEDYNDSFIPVTVGDPTKYGDQFHVDTQFNTQDLSLSMDAFSDRVIKPAIAAIGNRIDRVGALMAKNNTANIVGVPGTTPTGLLTYLTAGAYLDSEAAPRDRNRAMIIEQFTSATIVDSLKGLFTPNQKLDKQYMSGLMGTDSAGMDWKMDQNVVSHTFGTWTTVAGTLTANTSVNAAFVTSGWASSSTITLTNSTGITFNQGDTITIASLFGANPQNRQSYGKLRSFVVNQAATAAAGTISINVSPAIITAGQFQNVQIIGASATAAVTVLGIGTAAAGVTTSPQNIMLHKNAFALACADLEVPDGVHFAGRAADPGAGLSIRIVRQYTINNDALPCRLDVLFGWAPLYPEMACRVAA